MDCAACGAKVRGAVERLPGVARVDVMVMGERLTLDLAPGTTPPERIEGAVKALGYGIAPRGAARPKGLKAFVLPGQAAAPEAAPATAVGASLDAGHGQAGHVHQADAGHGASGHVHDDPADRGRPWWRTSKGQLVILTGLLLAMAWGFELLTSAETGRWAFVLATLVGLTPVARRAFAAARAGQPFTIEMLMTVAALGALVIDAAEEAALVVFLFAVGEVLEGVAASRARAGIRALAALVPKTALLEMGGTTREVPAESLAIGQVVLVRPGDRVPADGTILEGTSGIDESPVTGESVPKTKGPGEDVYAGSINAEAALRVTVTRAAEDNTIARIIRLVEEAESARAPTERFIDRFSRVYMPAVCAVALLVIVVPPLLFGEPWGTWVYRGLALLLIGCPCALVISVPASIASALASGARRGVLMKGGAVIEAAARVTRVAFDKTGTLTVGRPAVTDVVPLGGTPGAEVLAVAAAVEAGSSHPLAQAIRARAETEGVSALPSSDARALVGQGVEARVGGALAWVASPRFAAEARALDGDGLRRASALEEEGKTVVVAFREGRALGLLALRDEPRPDAARAVAELRRLGVSAVMLTGDNRRTAQAIAGGLGLDHEAELMPEDKVAAIRAMTGGAGGVMMVGDGINDAPALAQASVGVAMGEGTDVALETADAAVLRSRVTDVPGLIRLARAAMGNIRQNVALALGLKAVFLVTTVLGVTGLWIAILADTGATVLVTLNALRLLAFDPSRER
ncbi:heavy metal translocating P-type ATPase [Rubellimicrobium aerolatum]